MLVSLLLIFLIAFGITSKVQAESTTTYSTTVASTTIPFIINGTTTIAFVPAEITSTAPPLWKNSTTSIYTTTILPSQCYSSTVFYCLSPVYSSTTGNLSVETGQNVEYNPSTIENWTNVYVVFVPQGTKIIDGIPNVSFNPSHAAYVAKMYSGFGYVVNLPVSSPGTYVGTKMSGSIWMKYTLQGSSMPQYVEVTTINMTAIGTNSSSTNTFPQGAPLSIPTASTSSSASSTVLTSVKATITSQSSNNTITSITSFVNGIITFFKNLLGGNA